MQRVFHTFPILSAAIPAMLIRLQRPLSPPRVAEWKIILQGAPRVQTHKGALKEGESSLSLDLKKDISLINDGVLMFLFLRKY